MRAAGRMPEPTESGGLSVAASLGGRIGARTLGILLVLLLGAGCSRVGLGGSPGAPGPTGEPVPVVQTPVVPERGGPAGATRILEHPPLVVDEVDPILNSVVGHDPWLTGRVQYWIDFWTSRGSEHFERYIERMARYHEFVDREIADRGLPTSLRFLPVVESGYHHGAVSRVGATGMWQIMTPTARDLGLSVSALVDDRRDPMLSTRAALEYLQRLHGIFDSWYLALAAYNSGQGRVSSVLRRFAPADGGLHGDELYLLVRDRLPAETRDFIPRFLAAAAIAGDPERYGFTLPTHVERIAFDEVVVPDATSFDVLARAAGVNEDEIRELNPHFLRGFTPAGEARAVRVPAGTADIFDANFALIPPEERISFLEHAVASGETLTHIARRYSVSVAELSAANGNLDPRRLQVGSRLIVPVAGATSATEVAAAPVTAGADDPATDGGSQVATTAAAPERDPEFRHTVRSGENLWVIARRYGVSVADLQRWNQLGSRAVLQPGTELVVGAGLDAVSGARIHRVRSGDTWGGIAERYGVSIAALTQANGRTRGDVIRVGEELRIP